MLNINKKTGEIFVYGELGNEAINDLDVIDALNELNGRRVKVRINSGGGAADIGIAIYEALKRYPYGVDTAIDSLAASAASIVALAGQQRSIASGGRVMIHRAMTVAAGNVNDLEQMAGVLRIYDDSIASIYAQYMPESKAEILKMMDKESWFSADKAFQSGLVTSVIGSSGKPVAQSTPKKQATTSKANAFPVHRQAAATLLRLSSRF